MSFEKEYIDDELLNNPDNGFQVPDGYFELLQNNILAKTTDNGFTVPEKYFNTLDNRIQQKIKKSKVINHHFAFKRMAMGVAASFILIAGFLLIKNQLYPSMQSHVLSQNKLNELSDEEIINYLDIADLSDNHIAESTVKTEVKSQNQVEDYLINNAEEELIIEQL
ncbi:MAG: hypothetical protein WCO54_05535 [Bacteroidota bacterium]